MTRPGCQLCGAELADSEVRGRQNRCRRCRERRGAEVAAERDFSAGVPGRPRRCRCERPIRLDDDTCFRCGCSR